MLSGSLHSRWHHQQRRAAAALAFVLIASAFAACGSGTGTLGTRSTPSPTLTVTATATVTVAPAPPGVYFSADGTSSATVYALELATGKVRWSRQLSQVTSGVQITSTGDILLAVDGFGKIIAVRMEDGAVLWSRPSRTGGHFAVSSQPVADRGILFVSSQGDSLNHGYLDAYRAADGAPLWEHDEGVNSTTVPGISNGVVYANTSQGVDALRGSDGTTVWQAHVSVGGGPAPLHAGDVVYLNSSGEVYALNAATGAQLWHYKPPLLASPSDESVSVGGGLVYAGNSLRLNALRVGDGTLAWHNDYHGLVWGPSYANGVLYVSVSAGFTSPLYALNPSDGSQIWSAQLSGNGTWPAELAHGTLYLSRSLTATDSPAGYLYALNPASGAVLWQYKQSGVGFTNAIVP
jgi:outer membrane protein assembly factor BamB